MSLYKDQNLKIYNTLTGEKELFKPITPGFVGMYVCGPTVYSNVHLGNVRTFMSFDMIYRYLLHLGYKVRYVRNITDAGHLTDDEAEDKISTKARIEKVEPMEIVQKYTVDFHNVLQSFNLLPPNVEPTATGHIVEQIEATKKIMDAGLAYESNGSVYFDVLKYNETKNYGILSKRIIEDAIENTRVLDGQSDKKNPQDFALWKKAEPEHIQRWPSPWSDGFPGWHLECTVMSTKYLGKHFDIHGGGMDLKFPHHECEIAQAEACHDKAPVNYWMHTNMLNLNGKKMSKSTGNFLNPSDIYTGENDILSKSFSPNVTRFSMMQAHYKSVLDLTNDALLASEKGYNRLMEAIKIAPNLKVSASSTFEVNTWKQKCYDAMNDDFNTPILIANLFDAVKFINQVKDNKATVSSEDLASLINMLTVFTFDIIGLKNEEEAGQNTETLSGTIELLIKLRAEAKANKNYALSDQIRNELLAIGVQLKDGREGTTYTLA